MHPQQPERLLIVVSNQVYHSDDAGMSWTPISAGLPWGAKYCAVWENTGKNGIYVGGFGFVAYTNDDLKGQWIGFFEGLPNVRVYELEINYLSETIFAGTYGRGLWESRLYHAPSSSAIEPTAPLSARLYPNPAQDRLWLEVRSEQVQWVHLEILAPDGRLVGSLYRGPWPSVLRAQEIALPLLPAGIYLYRLTTDMGHF